MTPDDKPMDAALERAVSEIRSETIPAEAVDAAAARVWTRLSNASIQPAGPIRNCADFQALIPEFRAGRLDEAPSLLLRDHLRECVACRRIFDGKVIPLPAPAAARHTGHSMRWALAAGVVAAGGLAVWFSIVQLAPHSGRALVRTVNGTLYAISPGGVRVMTAGEELPDGVEIRTARDSGAVVILRDGSQIEMRERSDFSTSQAGNDVTAHLGRGSLIVQAAKRRSGHLYVATSDCRVAVTGTVFGVSAGVKGSRVSVIEGEVRMLHDNQERILHPGDQASTSELLEPVSFREDLAWSRNEALLRQLGALRSSLNQLPVAGVRYSSRLLGALPASTVFFASIPNLAQYFGEAQGLFRQRAAENPELRDWLAGPGAAIEPMLEKMRAANEYLGEEIVIFGASQNAGPVFLAEEKRPGVAEFLRRQGLPPAVPAGNGMVMFSHSPGAHLPALDGSFRDTPFYARIAEAYREGAGILLGADLSRLGRHGIVSGARYLIAEQKRTGSQLETRAAFDFDGPRSGIAGWLAPPSPMGALDYISPEATFVAAFAVKDPAAILDEGAGAWKPQGFSLPKDAARSLGSEFALALDGQAFPVPSWKLVAEVYDPVRFEAAIQEFVTEYNGEAAARGGKLLRTGQETADGRTDYMLAGADPNPLTEAHYTFANGYLIAAPTRALLARALEVHTNGAGITRSPAFTAMLPRDAYTNFSALVYQNLGTTLAPLTGLLGAFGRGNAGSQRALEGLGNLKPWLVAAYAEAGRLTIASRGDMLGMSLNNFLSGSLLGMAGNALPLGQFMGTRRPEFSSR